MITLIAKHNGICTKCGGAIVKNEHMGFERGSARRWCNMCVKRAESEKTFKKQEARLKWYKVT